MNKLKNFFTLFIFSIVIVFLNNTNCFATPCAGFFAAGERWEGDNVHMILLTSLDGERWTQVPVNFGHRDVVKGDKGYLAAGWCLSPILSHDGDSWQEVTDIGADCWNSVSWTNNHYFMSGGMGDGDDFTSLYSSENGKNFKQVYFKGGFSKITNVVFGNNRYIAVQDNNESIFSYDGITWNKLPPYDIGALTFDGSQFVAVNTHGSVGTSIDGFIWNVSHIDASINYLIWIKAYHRYVAVGDSGKILTSQDAKHWQLRKSGTSENLHKITWDNGLYVAVGNNGTILTSKDSVTWKKQNSHTDYDLIGVA